MTNEQAEALGRRWIAAGGGWRAGMLCGKTLNSPAFRVVNVPGLRGDCWGNDAHASGIVPDVSGAHSRDWFVSHDDDENGWPDLRDAATRGAALEVVRERRHASGFGVMAIAHYWIEEESEPYDPTIAEHARPAWTWNGSGLHAAHIPVFRSEPEALVAALEAAHKVTK